METTRTLVCKLNPTLEQRTALDATLQAFADACNFIADVARAIHSSHKVKVQQACYHEVRTRFGLSANLAIRAIARVCAALKVKAKAHSTFAPTSIDYDQRIFSFCEWDWTCSLTFLHSRQRLAIVLGERQRQRLTGQQPASATLVKRRDGTFFLHVQLADTAPATQTPTGTLGVDLGRRRVAVDSDHTPYEAVEVQWIGNINGLLRCPPAAQWMTNPGYGLRWYEVSKYLVGPISMRPHGALALNKNTWKRLPPDI